MNSKSTINIVESELYKSTNMGDSWEIIDSTKTRGVLVISESNPNVLYGYTAIISWSQYLSPSQNTDGWKTWTDQNQVFEEPNVPNLEGVVAWFYLLDDTNPDDIFMNANGNLFVSNNGGNKYLSIQGNLYKTTYQSVRVGYKYFVSTNGGIYSTAVDFSFDLPFEQKLQPLTASKLYPNYPKPFRYLMC